MTSIASAIASLLYDHDTVIVPGLGAFVRHDQSAHVNVITNEFQRPSSQLSFDSRQREENTLVGDFLVASDGITNDEARTAVATFVSDCFAQLKEHGSVTLPGLGTLSMDEQQDIAFEPDDNNFNSDAFGLEDLLAEPVYGTTNVRPTSQPVLDNPSTPPVTPSSQTQPVSSQSTTPSSQSTTASSQPSPSSSLRAERSEAKQSINSPTEKRKPHLTWLWLLLLLLIAAGVALWYFKFRPVSTKPWPLRPVPAIHPRESLLPRTENPEINDTLISTEANNTTSEETKEPSEVTPEPTPETPSKPIPSAFQTPAPVEVVKPEPTSKAFIVGGCFEVEKNALNMTVEAREQGCAEAFVMKRGSRYYVCYGQYPSTADAKAALPEVLAHYNAKAWILTK